MNTHQQVIIISAELSNLIQACNETRTFRLYNILKDIDINFKEAEGVYKGSFEKSFVCFPNSNNELNTIKGFAFEYFNQESVLIQDANGLAYLEFQDGSTQEIGRLREVSKQVAENSEAYSIIDNKFFLAS